MKQTMSALFASAAIALGAGVSEAQEIIFDSTSGGGTISHEAGDPAIGTDIVFNSVTGFFTPLNSNVTLLCDDPSTGEVESCLLDFTTGPVMLEGPPVSVFLDGGEVVLTGSLFTAAGTEVTGSGPILQGSFFAAVNFAAAPNTELSFLSIGIDTKDPGLAAFYGADPIATFTYRAIGVALDVDLDGSFSGTVSDSTLANRVVPGAVVPAPGTVMMLGGGLLTLAAATGVRSWRRRGN